MGALERSQVTIVVLNWNRKEETLACVESLMSAELGGARILVVDNGSRDGSVEALRARFPDLPLIALAENRGYAGGNNVGLGAALRGGAQAVLLLNNDTRVAPDFLQPLVDAMNQSPEAAAVTSAILRFDRPEMLDIAFSQVRFHERHVVQLQGVNALVGEGFDRRREVEIAVGCAMLIRAEALRRVGLFDEAYFAYHEDVDWCLRARQAGYHHFFEPYSRVFHRGSSSTTGTRTRPAPPPIPGVTEELPNAEPLQWNPVRTYLGARNTVRLLRTYANERERRAFVRDFLRALPLEFTAIVLGREGWMKLGRWTWGELARVHFLDRRGIARDPGSGGSARLRRGLRLALTGPVDLFWTAPRDVWRAVRTGRTAELFEVLRGLRDGALNRPLPLARLGLR